MIKQILTCGLFFVTCLSIFAASAKESDLNRLKNELTTINDQILEYQLVNEVFRKAKKTLKLENIKVTSKDDAEFKNGITPAKYAIWGKPIRYSARPQGGMFKGQHLFLYLPIKLKAGKTYSVTLKDTMVFPLDGNNKYNKKRTRPAPVLSFTYQSDNARSTGLHVNQIGYMPDAPKYAYLTQYTGLINADKDIKGDIDFSKYKKFSIIDYATGKTVFEGSVVPSPVCIPKDGDKNKLIKARLSDSRTWECDFSGFKTPGKYRVSVPGVGISYPFVISKTVYNQVFGVLTRGMMHQRCGTELTEKWTRHTHPACHTDDGIILDTDLYKKDDLDFLPQKSMVKQKANHGHHDAGDFGKYTYNGCLFASYILLPFEVIPDQLKFDNSPVPESGNGKADLLEEVKWELDWLTGMQDADDGGVHIIVKPRNVNYENNVSGKPAGKTKAQRKIYWKDIHVTATLAATLARAVRTEAFAKQYPKEIKGYLAQAEKAWNFCMKYVDKSGNPNENMVGGHHYGKKGKALDDYLWMSVEMWLTTGDKKYHDFFMKHDIDMIVKESSLWSWWPLHESWGMIVRAYTYGKRSGKNTERYEKCKKTVLNAVNRSINWQKQWAIRCSFAGAPYKYKKWGWYFIADVSTYDMLLARTLVDKQKAKKFLDAACLNADMELGNNPDDFVSITGLGQKRITDHVHQNSRFDGIIEPVPGIPLGFFPARAAAHWRGLPVWAFSYGGAPIAYRYLDAWTISQEFTVPNLATTVMTYAMLANAETQKSGKPALSVTGNNKESTIKGIVPFKVHFKAEAKGANGKAIREYCWDFGNEEFASESAFDYTFTIPGFYNICCTVTDEDGWIAYKYIKVEVKQPLATLPNGGTPLKATPDTVALFHFNGNFDNAIAGGKQLKKANAELSTENLMWMEKPSGKAVKCTGGDYAVKYDFGKNIFTDPSIEAVDIECIINFEAERAKQAINCYQFLLSNAHSHILGRMRWQWKGGSAVIPGKDKLTSVKASKKVLNILKPTPGWHLFSMGFNKKTGKGYIGFDKEKVEFDMKKGDFLNKNTILQFGAFTGYFDALRIRMKQKK
jgi:PKD repeat protein